MALPLPPITRNIREETFLSPFDGSEQTYLIVATASAHADTRPLLILNLHGALNHQDQGMTSGIYERCFDRFWSWIEPQHAIYVSPEYRGNSWMGPAAEADVAAILRRLRERHRPSRVLLTGGSMGGTSALIFASRQPHTLDGVLAWCPATDTSEMFERFPDHFLASYGGSPRERPEVYRERSSRYHADALARLPIAIIHGANDEMIPVHHARLLVEALRRRSARVFYEEIGNGGHDSPLFVDAEPALRFLMETAPVAGHSTR